MLRYFYLLCFLIYIILNFEYSSCKSLLSRRLKNDHRHKRENSHRSRQYKRHDYNIYDGDGVAEIDVARFINSGEDQSVDGNEPYFYNNKEMINQKYDYDCGNLNSELSNVNQDYSSNYVKNVKGISQYLLSDASTDERQVTNKLLHGTNLLENENLDGNIIEQPNRHFQEKKCILRNMKIPFFSRNNSAVTNHKNKVKRKSYGIENVREVKEVPKDINENLSEAVTSINNLNKHRYGQIKKRSYIQRMCPACKRKFIVLKGQKSQSKRNYSLKNFYGNRNHKNVETSLINNRKLQNKYDVDKSKPMSNKEFSNLWSDRRKKREEDDRNIERQKELECLEKQIESVTIHNSSDNKVHS